LGRVSSGIFDMAAIHNHTSPDGIDHELTGVTVDFIKR